MEGEVDLCKIYSLPCKAVVGVGLMMQFEDSADRTQLVMNMVECLYDTFQTDEKIHCTKDLLGNWLLGIGDGTSNVESCVKAFIPSLLTISPKCPAAIEDLIDQTDGIMLPSVEKGLPKPTDPVGAGYAFFDYTSRAFPITIDDACSVSDDWASSVFFERNEKFKISDDEQSANNDPPSLAEITMAAPEGFPALAAEDFVLTASGDFNGDGKTDLALAGPPSWTSVPVALSVGDGSFISVLDHTNEEFARLATGEEAGQASTRMVSCDIDGDGYDDLVLLGPGHWTRIPVAFSNGDGTFRVEKSPKTEKVRAFYPHTGLDDTMTFSEAASVPAADVLCTDLDGDGDGDLFLTGVHTFNRIPAAFSNGDGSFTYTDHLHMLSKYDCLTNNLAHVVSGDFDGDGKGDIACTGNSLTGFAQTKILTGFGRGNGRFAMVHFEAAEFAKWASLEHVSMVASDVNGDGADDLVLQGAVGWGSIPVALSRGTGEYLITNDAHIKFPLWASYERTHLVAGDWNGDGRGDIAVLGGQGWEVVPVGLSLSTVETIEVKQAPPPSVESVTSPGTHSRVAVRQEDGAVCYLNEVEEVVCEGYNGSYDWIEPPEGVKFEHLTAGVLHFCGITSDKEKAIMCWGGCMQDRCAAPSHVAVKAIDAGAYNTCAITVAESAPSVAGAKWVSEGNKMCWPGDNYPGCSYCKTHTMPAGVAQFAIGIYAACGLWDDGGAEKNQGVLSTPTRPAECWGNSMVVTPTPPESAHFKQIAVSKDWACGIDEESSEVGCWGNGNCATYPCGVATRSAVHNVKKVAGPSESRAEILKLIPFWPSTDCQVVYFQISEMRAFTDGRPFSLHFTGWPEVFEDSGLGVHRVRLGRGNEQD